jgi:hypothetical protein
MGREFIGECSTYAEDPNLASYERELAVKFIKQKCGEPPRGVDVEIGYEDSEYGSIPAIVVIWDDYETGCPEDYIQKCIEAYERFELPEDVHREWSERAALLHDLNSITEKLSDPD